MSPSDVREEGAPFGWADSFKGKPPPTRTRTPLGRRVKVLAPKRKRCRLSFCLPAVLSISVKLIQAKNGILNQITHQDPGGQLASICCVEQVSFCSSHGNRAITLVVWKLSSLSIRNMNTQASHVHGRFINSRGNEPSRKRGTCRAWYVRMALPSVSLGAPRRLSPRFALATRRGSF